jgi:CRISPR/Cas system-associated exonuclease Cas4 (RecB family)
MGRKIIGNLKFQKAAADGFDANEFAALLEQAYEGDGNQSGFKQKTTFSPSTIGYGYGNCGRYWFIAFEGAEFEEKFDAMARANMENGKFAHDRLQAKMELTGKVKFLEKEVKSDDPPIRGFIDLGLDWDGEEVIGEIKTAKEEIYLHKQSSMKPSPNHLLQILTYMKLRGSKQGFMFYENKNDQSFLIIPVNMNKTNEELIDYVFEWLREVRKNWENKTLPNRPFTKSTSACTYCPVKKVCWKELGEGEIEIEALKVPK